MELQQRTRILHTKSKKPVILGSSSNLTRIGASSSLSALSTGRQGTAPLASLDTDLRSGPRRRRGRFRDQDARRSASARRYGEGSTRIVCRDVLKSDQISDWSDDDDDDDSGSTSSASIPTRRHTMSFVARPRQEPANEPPPKGQQSEHNIQSSGHQQSSENQPSRNQSTGYQLAAGVQSSRSHSPNKQSLEYQSPSNQTSRNRSPAYQSSENQSFRNSSPAYQSPQSFTRNKSPAYQSSENQSFRNSSPAYQSPQSFTRNKSPAYQSSENQSFRNSSPAYQSPENQSFRRNQSPAYQSSRNQSPGNQSFEHQPARNQPTKTATLKSNSPHMRPSRMSSPPENFPRATPDREDTSCPRRQNPESTRVPQTSVSNGPALTLPRQSRPSSDYHKPSTDLDPKVMSLDRKSLIASARPKTPNTMMSVPPSSNTYFSQQKNDSLPRNTSCANSYHNQTNYQHPIISESKRSPPVSCRETQKAPTVSSISPQFAPRNSSNNDNNMIKTCTSPQQSVPNSYHYPSDVQPPSSLNVKPSSYFSSSSINSQTNDTRRRDSSSSINSPTDTIRRRESSSSTNAPTPNTRRYDSATPISSPTNTIRRRDSSSSSLNAQINSNNNSRHNDFSSSTYSPVSTTRHNDSYSSIHSPVGTTRHNDSNSSIHSPVGLTRHNKSNSSIHSPVGSTRHNKSNSSIHSPVGSIRHNDSFSSVNSPTNTIMRHNDPRQSPVNSTRHNDSFSSRHSQIDTAAAARPHDSSSSSMISPTNADCHNDSFYSTRSSISTTRKDASPPMLSPTNSDQSSYSARHSSSSSCDSAYSWRTDPRRRPFQADGGFLLSPGDDGPGNLASPSQDSVAHTPTAPQYSPPTTARNGAHQRVDNARLDVEREENLGTSRRGSVRSQQESYITPPCNSLDRRAIAGHSLKSQSPVRTQTNHDYYSTQNDHNRKVPPQYQGGKAYSIDINVVSNYQKSVSYCNQSRKQTHNTSFSRISTTSSLHARTFEYYSNDRGNSSYPDSSHRFGRKRDSMRAATEGSVDYLDLTLKQERMKQEYSKQISEYSNKYGVPQTHQRSHNEMSKERNDQMLSSNFSPRDTRNEDKSRREASVMYTEDSSRNNAKNVAQFETADVVPEPFVRSAIQRDSYRLATSSNPNLNSIDQKEDIYVSCEDILSSSQSTLTRNSPVPTSLSGRGSHTSNESRANSDAHQSSTDLSNNNDDFHFNALLKPYDNPETISRIKRNSLRLATASLSDLSVILDEIDISEPAEPRETPISNVNFAGKPCPVFTEYGPKLSPLVERSLGRSGSSVSSKNSSSFGSFYSCQSIGNSSNKSSPLHAPSSNSSPIINHKPKISTPDSIHKLIMANAAAHDSGISQSSEDTNSFYTSANTSIGSAEEMDYGVNHLPYGGSLNRRRPMFYWTRQAPYPRQATHHNTIPPSWKQREVTETNSLTRKSPRYPKTANGNIRSCGSTSSVESNGPKENPPPKPQPSSSHHQHLLERYGCGLDGNGSGICGKGSSDSLSHDTLPSKQPYHQQYRNGGRATGNRSNCTLSIAPQNQCRPANSGFNYEHYDNDSNSHNDSNNSIRYPVGSDSLTPTLESPTDTMRSPPSLGRPKRKLYAGFDSQPLPMDTFMSDSSSICTDSGTFDESFYSIDYRSADEEDVEGHGLIETTLTSTGFMNLSDLSCDAQLLHQGRSNSIHSTSTAKEGDTEFSDDDDANGDIDDVISVGGDLRSTMTTPFPNHHHQQHHNNNHHAWPASNHSHSHNHNHGVTASIPMTFSI